MGAKMGGCKFVKSICEYFFYNGGQVKVQEAGFWVGTGYGAEIGRDVGVFIQRGEGEQFGEEAYVYYGVSGVGRMHV
jgi:hypothetical protein